MTGYPALYLRISVHPQKIHKIVTGQSFSSDTWIHLAVAWSRRGGLHIYKNAQELDQNIEKDKYNEIQGSWNRQPNIRFGAPFGSNISNYPATFDMDEFYFWDIEPNYQKIKDVYTKALPGRY